MKRHIEEEEYEGQSGRNGMDFSKNIWQIREVSFEIFQCQPSLRLNLLVIVSRSLKSLQNYCYNSLGMVILVFARGSRAFIPIDCTFFCIFYF